jgi:hypothetical protein
MPFGSCAWSAGVILFLSIRALAGTVAIEYSLTDLGGGDYRYSYTVFNDGSLPNGDPIRLIDILFDPTLYDESSLQIATPDPPASDWDELILASVSPLPAAYDALALAPFDGIPAGTSARGFAVEFHWLGQGLPGPQSFEIYSPGTQISPPGGQLHSNFVRLQIGTTTSIPEPSFFYLPAPLLAYWSWRTRGRSASGSARPIAAGEDLARVRP